MGNIDTGTTCAYPGCDEVMFNPASGRLIDGGRQRWLCPEHQAARWTPRGFTMDA